MRLYLILSLTLLISACKSTKVDNQLMKEIQTTVPYQLGMNLTEVAKRLKAQKQSFEIEESSAELDGASNEEKRLTPCYLISLKNQKLSLEFNTYKKLIYITIGEIPEISEDEGW